MVSNSPPGLSIDRPSSIDFEYCRTCGRPSAARVFQILDLVAELSMSKSRMFYTAHAGVGRPRIAGIGQINSTAYRGDMLLVQMFDRGDHRVVVC